LPRLKGNLIIFSNDKDNVVMRSNIDKGGYGIYADEGKIFIQKSTHYESLSEIGVILRNHKIASKITKLKLSKHYAIEKKLP